MAREIDKAPITSKEFVFMGDFAAKFKSSVEYLMLNPPKDDFDDYLSSWAVSLGVLAHDVLCSLIALLKIDRTRAAYMLQRPLLDYHTRLRYYVLQASKSKAKWEANGKKSTKNYLQQCDVYTDWRNAEDKVFDIIAKRGDRMVGLDEMSKDARKYVLDKLAKEKRIFSRRVSHMAEVTKDTAFGSFYLEHQILSGHLHGDQITIIETIRGGDLAKGNLEVYWESERLSPYLVLANAFVYCHEFMKSIEMIRGWCYAKDSSLSHAFRELRRAPTVR